jgi:hypothetical protein
MQGLVRWWERIINERVTQHWGVSPVIHRCDVDANRNEVIEPSARSREDSFEVGEHLHHLLSERTGRQLLPIRPYRQQPLHQQSPQIKEQKCVRSWQAVWKGKGFPAGGRCSGQMHIPINLEMCFLHGAWVPCMRARTVCVTCQHGHAPPSVCVLFRELTETKHSLPLTIACE